MQHLNNDPHDNLLSQHYPFPHFDLFSLEEPVKIDQTFTRPKLNDTVKYLDSFGPETVHLEYKEFTLNHAGLGIEIDTAEDLIKTNEWVFNSFVLENLKKYINIYVPKYCSAFLDEHCETIEGELIIGVDDNGIINGIPFQGELDEILLKRQINKYIKIKTSTDSNIDLSNYVTISLVKVDYEKRKISRHNDLYITYLKNKQKIKKEAERYEKQRKYITKLVNLCNSDNTRKELIKYIKSRDPDSRAISLLEGGMIIEPKNHDEIAMLKDDNHDPYYWVTRWKDDMVSTLKLVKPKLDIFDISNFLKPHNIIMKVSPMIPWWLQNNDNMNLYIIRIHFNKPEIPVAVYYNDSLGRINRCYRTTEKDKPCCWPLVQRGKNQNQTK
jgi:hypothetical protein